MDKELLLFRAIFLTPNAALPGLRWNIFKEAAGLFWRPQNGNKPLATEHFGKVVPPFSKLLSCLKNTPHFAIPF